MKLILFFQMYSNMPLLIHVVEQLRPRQHRLQHKNKTMTEEG